MFRVISDSKYREWCKARGLDLDRALFHLETAYLGQTWRSRPGALIVTGDAITHYSYKWTDTLWAIGEPTVRVDIPISSIVELRRESLSTGDTVKFLWPAAAFTVVTASGERHFLALQRDHDRFEEVVRGLLRPAELSS